MLFSHPNIKLIDHLNGVLKIGLENFYSKKGIKFPFPLDHIEKAIKNILFFHDIGKATPFFQKYLKETIKNEEITVPKKLRAHSLISAFYTGIFTLKQTKSIILSLLSFEVVKNHHGNLEDFKDMVTISNDQLEVLNILCRSIKTSELGIENKINFKEIKEFSEKLFWEIEEKDLTSNHFYTLNFLFSLLIYSDKTEVIFHKNTQDPNLIKNSLKKCSHFVEIYKNSKFKNSPKNKINEIRNDIYRQVKEFYDEERKIFSINVPTGTGKTISVLNFAFKILSKSKHIHRIIYALPFTSIVDQTAEIVKEIFKKNNINYKELLTVHHHLSEINYKKNDNDIDKIQFLIENWDDPVILTTFWQLFNSVLTNKNSQLRKFHNFANSLIILDEIQTIPYIYWGTIKDILKNLGNILNSKAILMTATMPMIFDEKKNEIFPIIKSQKRNKYFSTFSRYKIVKINNLKTIYLDELVDIAINNILSNKNKSYLFVFNTIKSSVQFYRKIKDHLKKEKIIYLSTNILPIDRSKRIKEINNFHNRKIVISTQLIEAGVDIDMDIVYRDFGPLDNIIQTAGRCNRNDKQKGKFYLFMLRRDREVSNEDVYFIYPKTSLIPTKDIFNRINELDEKNLLKYIEAYYKEIKNNSTSDTSTNLNDYIKRLDYNKVYNSFQLIKNIKTEMLFVEKDNTASEILKVVIKILGINDRFERKKEFLKIKKTFYDYVLSLKIYNYESLNTNIFKDFGFFKVLQKNILAQFYDKEIGFYEKSYELI